MEAPFPATTTWKSPESIPPMDPNNVLLRPSSLNHYALATLNMDVTHSFWTEVMGCKFRGAVRHVDGDEGLGGSELGDFLHCFYGFEDGSCIAFFEPAEAFTPKPDGIPFYAKHLALSVPSREALNDWKQHLEACEVPVFAEIDHDGLWYSLYLIDPNGQQVELTYQSRDLDDNDVKEGLRVFKEWREDQKAGKV